MIFRENKLKTKSNNKIALIDIMLLQLSRAKPGNPASIYIIQFLHAGRISLTPPRAPH